MAKRLKVDCETACMITVELGSFLSRGFEWGYLDNSKQLFFGSLTVNFMQKETKTPPKRAMLFCSVYQKVFGHFPTIPDHFGRLPKFSKEKSEKYNASLKGQKPKKFPQMFLDGCHAGLL